MRRILVRTGATTLAALAGLGGLIILGLQTRPGQDALASLLSRLASSPDQTITIERISGFVPFDIHVGRINVTDRKGAVAEVTDATLRWKPLALLGGRIHVEDLSAGTVHLFRLPESQAQSPASGQSFSLPSLPSLRLDHLSMPNIGLGAPVLGQPVQFAINGSAAFDDPAQGLQLALTLDRKDVPGRFAGTLRYLPDGEKLDLDIEASEPAGGLVGTLLSLRDQPALRLAIKGSGTLKNWDGALDLAANETERLKGTVQLRAAQQGINAGFAFNGDLAPLVSEEVAPLVAGASKLTGTMTIGEDKKLAIDSLALSLAALSAEMQGTLDLAADQTNLTFKAEGSAAKNYGALARGLDWSGLHLSGSARGALLEPLANAKLVIDQPSADGYGARTLAVNATTQHSPLAPLALRVEASASGLRADSPKIAQAIGKEARFSADGLLSADHAMTWTSARLDFLPLEAQFEGKLGGGAFNGTMQMPRLDLSAFAPLVGRPVDGTMQLSARFDGAPDLSQVAIDLSGDLRNLKMNIPAIDRPFKQAKFNGALSRAKDGTLSVKSFTLNAQGLDLTANGIVDSTQSDLKFDLAAADLSLFDDRLAGKANVTVAVTGSLNKPGLDLTFRVPQGQAMGQRIEDLRLAIIGADLIGAPQAQLTLAGKIGGKTASGSGQFLTRPDQSQALEGLDLSLGSVRLVGQGTRAVDGALDGKVQIKATDLGDLSPLILAQLGGRLDAEVSASMQNGKPIINAKGNATNLLYDTYRLAASSFDLRVADPQASLLLDGKASLSGIEAAGARFDTLRLNAASSGPSSTLSLAGEGYGSRLTADALLTSTADQKAVTLRSLRLARSDVTATLSPPAQLLWRDGTLTIDRFVLAANRGQINVRGRAGKTLALDVAVQNLPLAVARASSPDLDLRGTVNATVNLTGSASAPSGRYSVSVKQFTMPQLIRSGVRPLDASASGQLDGKRVSIDGRLSGLSGRPFTVTGSAPLGDGALALKLRGTLALEQANALLATSGMRVGGEVTIDTDVKGTIAAPQVYGSLRLANGAFEDVVNGVKLDPITATATASGRDIRINSFTAQTQTNGSLHGQGQIRIDPAAGFPGSIDIGMNNAVLVSSDLMRFIANGKLNLTGSLSQRPKVAGRIDVKALDINIQERLPGSDAEILRVHHINVPANHPIAKRMAEAERRKRNQQKRPQPFIADLDLTIAAVNNVFVHGMGMAAELSGNLHITGTSAAPQTSGAFDLQRGQFDVLGRRLTFTEGHVAFNGTTDPDLNFTTETTSSDITAKILVTGTASEPKISFSSTPELPQDEILARLLFGRSTGSLTTSQAIQLAQTVAQFSGGGSSALNSLRKTLGVDTLGVDTSSGSGAQFGLGKRLNDRIYLGVTQGTTPSSSRATVDIDITRNLKVTGSSGMDGGAELGIGGQWDYR
ncbi:translocation/assembly module TamB domain-containing protein [Beijerinckia mobilis]|uniref:translocation/assembly module TamB domain-containing protein n=1 Tax=Beijerinckia mobilis TaxID=231434 RepID=UPI00068CE213|nr:translocation/assembly module TamB domain-containing protein [Beijerinckia mobilis]